MPVLLLRGSTILNAFLRLPAVITRVLSVGSKLSGLGTIYRAFGVSLKHTLELGELSNTSRIVRFYAIKFGPVIGWFGSASNSLYGSVSSLLLIIISL